MHLVRGWHFLCRKENTISVTQLASHRKVLIRMVRGLSRTTSCCNNFISTVLQRFDTKLPYFLVVNMQKFLCRKENIISVRRWLDSLSSCCLNSWLLNPIRQCPVRTEIRHRFSIKNKNENHDHACSSNMQFYDTPIQCTALTILLP